MAMFSGIAAAVAGALSATIGATAAGVVGAAVAGAVAGAVIGGVTAAITGGDILKGVLTGGLIGAVTGGIGEWLSPGAATAAAEAAVAPTSAVTEGVSAIGAVTETGADLIAGGGEAALNTAEGTLAQGAADVAQAAVPEAYTAAAEGFAPVADAASGASGGLIEQGAAQGLAGQAASTADTAVSGATQGGTNMMNGNWSQGMAIDPSASIGAPKVADFSQAFNWSGTGTKELASQTSGNLLNSSLTQQTLGGLISGAGKGYFANKAEEDRLEAAKLADERARAARRVSGVPSTSRPSFTIVQPTAEQQSASYRIYQPLIEIPKPSYTS